MKLSYNEAKNLEGLVRGIAVLKPKFKQANKIRKQFLRPIRRVVSDIDAARAKAIEEVGEATKEDLDNYKARQDSKIISEKELESELALINVKRENLFLKIYNSEAEDAGVDVPYSEGELEILMNEIDDIEKETAIKAGIKPEQTLNMYDLLDEKKEDMATPEPQFIPVEPVDSASDNSETSNESTKQ